MSALLELIREAPPEDRKVAAEMLMPYLPRNTEPELPQLLSVYEFRHELKKQFGITKRPDWIRNDLFAQCPALKDYAYGLGGGYGRPIKIDKQAIDWIEKHQQLIDWKG